MTVDQLTKWRQQIDQIDQALLEQLALRKQVVRQVMQWKLSHQKPLLDLKREQQMIKILKAKAKNLGLDEGLVENLYQQILIDAKKESS